MRASRETITPDLQPRPSAASSLARLSLPTHKTSSGIHSSATWTSTSGDLNSLSDTDEIGDRENFTDEYNRLAKKYGVRPLVPDDPGSLETIGVLPKRGWWSRTFRRTSSQSTENSVRRQRSTSHVMAHLAHPKRDSLKDQDLQGLVRLCGKSFLYLPPEYAPGSLILPTCFRATAQYLVQHAPETRGVFRIPGSIRVVNELYEFYCAEQAGGDVANTVRSPSLPSHINAGIHDVASCFKKFLSGIPGGILGSLSLFDALVAINSQLYCDPEFSRTKQTKIRARLIALSIGTLRSQFRRELICAVFGLLCLLGRAAETAPREDEYGRPLPTSDLMGYNALGIVFGPLLVGDILGSHAVKLADPTTGLFLVAASPSPKSKKERKKAKEPLDEPQEQKVFLDVDRIHVANDVTEMLITNWRDVVRQIRNLDGGMSILRRHSRASVSNDERGHSSSFMRPSEHDDFAMKKSTGRNLSEERPAGPGAPCNRAVSFSQMDSTEDALSVRKTRPNSAQTVSNLRRSSIRGRVLSPPREESAGEDRESPAMRTSTPLKSSLKSPRQKASGGSVKEDPTSDENVSPKSNNPSPPPRSPTRITSRGSSTKNPFDFQTQRSIDSQRKETLGSTETRDDYDFVCTHRCRSTTPKSDKPTMTLKAWSQVDGSPERPLPPSDNDPMIAYLAGPGVKVLNAPSTLRSRPRTPNTVPKIAPIKIGPCVQKALSQGSTSSEATDTKEPSKKSNSYLKRHKFAPDQMDGVADVIVSAGLCRGSFTDLRSEFEKRGNTESQKSSQFASKSRLRPRAILTKKNGQSKGHSWTTPRNTSPRSINNTRGDVKPGASKVRGLAAMFDSAAKASPFVPTPGGAMEKKRRDTARVISPYTSNPSPRASLQSVTSVSTPVSLMSPSRISIDLTPTLQNSSRKSMIPRLQNSSTTDGAGKTERHVSPRSSQRDDSRISMAHSNATSRIPTPSRLHVKKTTPQVDLPSLPQLDGCTKMAQFPMKLTAQQEIRPIGYYSSPTTQTKTDTDYRDLPRLSQHSTTSEYSEGVGQSRDASSLSPNPMQSRSASSLRDQIRGLRTELSARNEDFVQIRLELEEVRKTNEVNEILLREDLDRLKVDVAKWRRRAERAESKVDRFERLALQVKNARDRGDHDYRYHHGQGGDAADDYSFMSGSDHINNAERLPQPLIARMNQSVRRSTPVNIAGADSANSGGGDEFSECSGSTVVRNIAAGPSGNNALSNHGLWSVVDELVDFASSELVD